LKAIPEWYSGKYTESKLIDEAYEATDFFPSLGDKGKWLRFTAAAIRNAAGDLIGVIETLEDITDRILAEEERKRLESQLVQAQKMEAIGTLAGGIAHDFNNILSAIIGYTQLAMMDLHDKEKAENELNEVLKAGGRAKGLVSHILTFSRKTETEYSPLELPSIIKESLKMLRSVIPTSIEISQDIIQSGLVMSDPTQIHQIIINLCTNAAQAMDKAGGVLEVSLKNVTINGDAAARDLDLSPGPYFRITVKDTGLGIPPEFMERIFEPYFTTKEVGRGTGLGLSVVHGIVKNHQGAITCKSTPGEGTTFEVYLPELESGKESSKHQDDTLVPQGTERILFIDDEPVLVNLANKMLSKLGYTVVTETSSLDALEIFRRDPYHFDLVITDMTMPGMTGDRLAQTLIGIREDIPVILCTGYSGHISEDRAKSIGIREFIMKPFDKKVMARTIRKVFDRG
jgi:signal transduction histidine kinase/CheY-like chemotaxis protein